MSTAFSESTLQNARELCPGAKQSHTGAACSQFGTKAQKSTEASKATKTAYNDCVKKAKQAEQADDKAAALEFYCRAQSLLPGDPKLAKKISKFQAQGVPMHKKFMHCGGTSDAVTTAAPAEDPGFHRLNKELKIPSNMWKSLFPYQKQGVEWLASLEHGGILGDDMGLGKTLQTVSFITAGFVSNCFHNVLVFAPVSVVGHWRNEFLKWAPGLSIAILTSSSNRSQVVQRHAASGGVLITSYSMALAMHQSLSDIEWDWLVADEGHKLKNHRIKTYLSLQSIPVKHRLLLTGTPVQNNLHEFWALFNLASPGLLSDHRSFRRDFGNDIEAGADKHASEEDKRRAHLKTRRLKEMIGTCFLRRDKATVFKGDRQGTESGQDDSQQTCGDEKFDTNTQKDNDAASLNAEKSKNVESSMSDVIDGLEAMRLSSRKTELIVWVSMTPVQKRLYEAALEQHLVFDDLHRKCILSALIIMVRLANHPRLVQRSEATQKKRAMREQKGIQNDSKQSDALAAAAGDDSFEEEQSKEPEQVNLFDGMDKLFLQDRFRSLLEPTKIQNLAAESAKIALLLPLLLHLRHEKHRCLVFSQSKVMLSMIEMILSDPRALEQSIQTLDSEVGAEYWRPFTHLRVDGGVKSACDRQDRIDQFNADSSIDLFILTTQTGGVGINLVGADRVIIIDPAWNPTVDAQAVDRCYRVGQKRDVVVYRMISAGTVEEKIYRRQVFKKGLDRAVTHSKNPFRYFSQGELKDLFRLSRTDRSDTCEALNSLHQRAGLHADADPNISRLQRGLTSLKCVAGVSYHDHLFSVRTKETFEQSELNILDGVEEEQKDGQLQITDILAPKSAAGRAKRSRAGTDWKGGHPNHGQSNPSTFADASRTRPNLEVQEDIHFPDDVWLAADSDDEQAAAISQGFGFVGSPKQQQPAMLDNLKTVCGHVGMEPIEVNANNDAPVTESSGAILAVRDTCRVANTPVTPNSSVPSAEGEMHCTISKKFDFDIGPENSVSTPDSNSLSGSQHQEATNASFAEEASGSLSSDCSFQSARSSLSDEEIINHPSSSFPTLPTTLGIDQGGLPGASVKEGSASEFERLGFDPDVEPLVQLACLLKAEEIEPEANFENSSEVSRSSRIESLVSQLGLGV